MSSTLQMRRVPSLPFAPRLPLQPRAHRRPARSRVTSLHGRLSGLGPFPARHRSDDPTTCCDTRRKFDQRIIDSPLLPPLGVSPLRHRQPAADVVNNASSPTGAASRRNVTVPGDVASGVQGLSVASRRRLLPAAGAASLEPAPSVHQKDCRSNVSTSETTDLPSFSPLLTSDRARAKPEPRLLKSVNDVISDLAPGSDRPTYRQAMTPTPKVSRPGRAGRETRSLPKISPSDESFSIRRKIEQYRKWHEEQYAGKLNRLRVEMEQERSGVLAVVPDSPARLPEIDYARILEDNIRNILRSPTRQSASSDVATRAGDVTTEMTGNGSRQPRVISPATWRTWRDVNDSYAYSDVRRYIEENELLPAERLEWIHAWLSDVHKACLETQS